MGNDAARSWTVSCGYVAYGLRVIDASVMPRLIGVIPTHHIMVAERAADMLRAGAVRVPGRIRGVRVARARSANYWPLVRADFQTLALDVAFQWFKGRDNGGARTLTRDWRQVVLTRITG